MDTPRPATTRKLTTNDETPREQYVLRRGFFALEYMLRVNARGSCRPGHWYRKDGKQSKSRFYVLSGSLAQGKEEGSDTLVGQRLAEWSTCAHGTKVENFCAASLSAVRKVEIVNLCLGICVL